MYVDLSERFNVYSDPMQYVCARNGLRPRVDAVCAHQDRAVRNETGIAGYSNAIECSGALHRNKADTS